MTSFRRKAPVKKWADTKKNKINSKYFKNIINYVDCPLYDFYFLITWLQHWVTENVILRNKLHFFHNNEITELAP